MFLSLDKKKVASEFFVKVEHDTLFASNRNLEKSKPQMGFEPTNLRDLVRCSNHWATGDSMACKGEMWDFD